MLALSATNENELIQGVLQGDEKAFRQLFDHYWPGIFSVAFSLTKSSVLSEEIVQDVFLKVWLKREQLATVNNFPGYLFTIAKNHIYNELRR
ncbi:MAG TPA: sigma factor, partial [Flavisolibacter sp.]|nr:sigma factor [Flavisolibacter sp.]